MEYSRGRIQQEDRLAVVMILCTRAGPNQHMLLFVPKPVRIHVKVIRTAANHINARSAVNKTGLFWVSTALCALPYHPFIKPDGSNHAQRIHSRRSRTGKCLYLPLPCDDLTVHSTTRQMISYV